MRHFMKFMCVILAVIMMLCLSACSDSNEGTTDPAETTLPTTQSSEPAQTTAPQQTPSGYVVNVVDENGSPIVGAVVQLCKDNCYPSTTDANGRAVFELAEDDYKVSFIIMPAGYTYRSDVQEFYFDEGSCEMTIVLKAAA